MVNVFVPAISVETSAAVAVMATPTDAVDVCVAGESEGAAATVLPATGRATPIAINPRTVTNRRNLDRTANSNH
jgi:hypothetical protein